MKRLYNLDYLRGFAALGIMLYHFLTWEWGAFAANTFLGRIGIYGVSIFYILSGLTLYHVYGEKMKPSLPDLTSFFRKRGWRIFPLLWLVTIMAILLAKNTPSIYTAVLNFSGLFGFVKWDAYVAVGAWSIGNELVFYVFFPLFILLYKNSKPLFWVLAAVILGVYLFFAFEILDPKATLAKQWKQYIHPLNQVWLFLAGFLIGLLCSKLQLQTTWLLSLLLLGMALFVFYPANGNPIVLVTGTNRLVFTVACLLICFACYKLVLQPPLFVHKPLVLLGEISYSLYLLHPIVYDVTGDVLSSITAVHLPDATRPIVAALVTFVASYGVYQYVEKYFIKFGHSKANT